MLYRILIAIWPDLLQRILRREHIYVFVRVYESGSKRYTVLVPNPNIGLERVTDWLGKDYQTYDQALKAGLEEAVHYKEQIKPHKNKL